MEPGMNSPTLQHVKNLFGELQEWKAESIVSNLEFYSSAVAHDELSIVPGKEQTTRTANCDVCGRKQKRGMRKFWFSSSRQVSCFWFHPCETCWNAIIQTTDIPLLLATKCRKASLAGCLPKSDVQGPDSPLHA